MAAAAPVEAEAEAKRLAALRKLRILDTEAEAEFDALVKVASTVCEVPIALVSLVDAERQWFKANIGLPDVRETPRDISFCGYTVLKDAVLEVVDATLDARFRENPLVVGAPGIRFYAAAPLTLSDCARVGTICVMDRAPRQLSDQQRRILRDLSVAAAKALEGRIAVRRLQEAANELESSERQLRLVVNHVPSMLAYWNRDLTCRFANRAYETWFGAEPDELVGCHLKDLLGPELFANNAPHLERALRGEPVTFERSLTLPDGSVRHALAHYVPAISHGEVIGLFAQVNDVSALKNTETALRDEIAEREHEHQLLIAAAADLMEAQRLGRIGSWEWHIADDQATISTEMYRILGLDPGSPAPRHEEYLHFYTSESATRLLAAIMHLRHTGTPYHLELQLSPQGSQQPLWVEARGEAVREQDGTITRLRGTLQDINERKVAEDALRKTQDFLTRTGAVAGVGGWELDLHGGTFLWSDEVCRIHGVEAGFSPTLLEAMAFYPPHSRASLESALRSALDHGQGFDLELEVMRPDASTRWVRAAGSVELSGQRAVRIAGAFQDVTERRRLTRELAEQHELLRITLQSIGDAVITTDAGGRVTWLNPVAELMTGWPADEAQGRPLADIFRTVDSVTGEALADPVAACLSGNSATESAQQPVLIARDGTEFGIEDTAAPIRNRSGELLGTVLVFHDVSEQRRMSGEMAYRASHDVLTGLVNRTEYDTRLTRLLNKAREDQTAHAMLFIDLDQFKLVNDACGHAVGDQLLQQISRLLGESIRTRDTLGRLGGDEFAILLEHCSIDQAERIAQKICKQMDDFRFVHEERRFRIGTSIGLVPIDARWTSIAAIQQAADSACYAAKEAGRNRVHIWHDSDAALRARRIEIQWAARIEHALDHGGFVLYAQRFRSLHAEPDGLRAEVLLRMKNDDQTVTLPGAFMPAAERFHLAGRIDRWVLKQVVAWMQEPDAGAATASLSVNLSGLSVGDRTFRTWACALLAEAGPKVCARLWLEITETAAITNPADAAIFVAEVRQLGVKVALDDFGAGASLFGYLKTLAVDYLKIDGQFIQDVVRDPLDAAAVRCFVDVAKVVGVQTVAEWVDHPAVLQRVTEMGVDFVQGFLIHRPEPIDTLKMPQRSPEYVAEQS